MREGPELHDRYESIGKRDFKTALLRLMEDEYKILGSRRIIMMLADDIEDLIGEYFPLKERLKFGEIVWFTTAADGQKVSYGKKTEDYNIKQVILPLVTREDVEARTAYKEKRPNQLYRKNKERDLVVMERISKSAKAQGAYLTGAEISVLMNRSLTIIISLYEQGISPADIVLKTGHNQDSVDKYIKAYDQVLNLVKKGHDAITICEVTGRSMNTIKQYLRLVKNFHPDLSVDIPKTEKDNSRSKNNISNK